MATSTEWRATALGIKRCSLSRTCPSLDSITVQQTSIPGVHTGCTQKPDILFRRH